MFKINVLGTYQGRHPQELFPECFEDVHWSWKNIQQLIVFHTTHFQANISCFPRCLQDVFAIRLPKTSSRHLEYFFKTSSRNLPRRPFQDVFKTSSKRHLAIMSWRRLEDIWEDKKMLPWRRLQDLFSTPLPRPMFAGLVSRTENNTTVMGFILSLKLTSWGRSEDITMQTSL